MNRLCAITLDIPVPIHKIKLFQISCLPIQIFSTLQVRVYASIYFLLLINYFFSLRESCLPVGEKQRAALAETTWHGAEGREALARAPSCGHVVPGCFWLLLFTCTSQILCPGSEALLDLGKLSYYVLKSSPYCSSSEENYSFGLSCAHVVSS